MLRPESAKAIGGFPRRDYGRRMMRAGKILFLLALGGLASPALAQDPYAVTAIKPYDGPVAAPPANGLAAVIRSEKPGTDNAAGKPKPAGEPLFTIHAFGGVEVGGSMR